MKIQWRCEQLIRGFILGAMICAIAFTASGQTFRGTILGSVTDVSGASVPGATITVKNTETGLLRTTESQADGSYSVPELPIGNYDVTVDKANFQSYVTKGVQVSVAAERRVDAALKPGQITEQILVSGAELPEIETTSDTLGGTLTQETVKDLPINGRDYTKLIYLNPGVAGSPDQITDSPGSFGEFSMNGARGRSNNYLLDGTDMNDGYRNDPAINQGGVFATPSAILPIDAVSDMRVLSNFEPEYGRSGGAVVNIVTRSGTNQIHGSAFEYFRNSALDARNFFNTSGEPKAPFHNNQFGGSVGGPIIKDKTFFFLDYEGQQEKVGVVTLACVPEPARIAFDEAMNGAPNPVIAALLARNPWPAPDHPISAAQASDPATGALYDSGCPNGPNATAISPSSNGLTSMIAKIDHSFGQKDSVTGRYFFGDSTQSFPLALSATGGQLPGFNTVTPTRVQLVSLSYIHIFSSTKLNELRLGWNRFAEGFFPQDQSFHPSSIGLCTASNAPGGTLPGATCSGSGPADSGLPIILVSVTPSGGSSFFAQPGANSTDPRHRVDSNVQLIDGFSWKIAKHDVKFGFEFRRTSVQQYFDKYFRGRLKFSSLSDFLEGNIHSGLQYSGDTIRHTQENDFGLYVQDSFRVTPRLTVNYGLRWDDFGVISEKNNLFSNFIVASFDPATDTGTGSQVQVGTPALPHLYQPRYRNFGPRANVAWDVFGNGKTVVRTGWGMFFDSTSQDMFLGHLPYPAFFAPGPAYANFGVNPITEATGSGIIAAGQPAYGASDCSSECDDFSVDPNIRTPYIENYNLNIQQQITSKVVLEVGYVGSQGHRLWRFFDINQPNAQAIHDAQCPGALGTTPGSDCSATAGATELEFAAPRVFSGPGVPGGTFYIFQENSSGKSNYNSLQASLHVNDWHGITSFVNFVWSRSMDNSSDGEDFVPNAAQPADSTNPNNEYGPSNFNIPKRVTWVFSYALPNMAGGWQRLRNGWGFDSTVTVQTGQPFTLNYNGEDDYSGSGEGYDRPDVVGPIVYNYHDPNNFLDLSSFAMPCTIQPALLSSISGFATDCVPGTQHFGNLGRNALQGPPFEQWDLAIYKNTKITERLNLQVRAEFFNIINHPNFSNPLLPSFIADPASNVSPFTSCACGFAANASGREVGNGAYHIVATGDVGIGNPFLGGGGPRGIQLAAKFSF
jgi:Carboxypeptidase regulatory-like domain/TonB dependent receptor